MSIQFGSWNFDGAPIDQSYLERVRSIVSGYAFDSLASHRAGDIEILFWPFHVTPQDSHEVQPQATSCGAVITWDGRLDNGEELASQFRSSRQSLCTDVDLVAAAYEEAGLQCLSQLKGDWALSIWDPRDRSLTLARDFAGVCPLYYSVDVAHVSWSSVLDPLVVLAGKSLELDREYVAGWLSMFPAANRTPYVGIHSVPPSSCVVIKNGKSITRSYWDFDPTKRVRYLSDVQYEEHFLQAFKTSVRRRLRSRAPVLAELSGGIDSSSIVCVADELFLAGEADTPRLDTLSYFDQREPNWDEQPYFEIVEKKRGRPGSHIEVDDYSGYLLDYPTSSFAIAPSSQASSTPGANQFDACLSHDSIRVVLSGVAGDEFCGGVPTPIPELATLLAGFQLRDLFRQTRAWALAGRKTIFGLAAEFMSVFLPPMPFDTRERDANWLATSFASQYRHEANLLNQGANPFGPSPAFQMNMLAIGMLRRQLSCRQAGANRLYETRYPFLDRDLLEFLFAVPREQLVRPGERRSLMRRSLRRIVPDEILDRKRKSFVSTKHIRTLQREWPALVALGEDMQCVRLGFVDVAAFQRVLAAIREGREIPIVPFLRTIALENWLRHAERWGHLRLPPRETISASAVEQSLQNKA